MTTFQIPEGKVVDSIEFKSGEKAAVLNIRYKEERQKEKKKAFAVVSTEQPTCVYLDLSKNKLTSNFPNFSARDHIPVRLAEEGEFVIAQKDKFLAAVNRFERQSCLCVEDTEYAAWRELVSLFVGSDK